MENKKENFDSKVIVVTKKDVENLQYPDDYVDEYGRIYQIPYLDPNDPNYLDLYEELMVIRKKYPDKFKKIMLGD